MSYVGIVAVPPSLSVALPALMCATLPPPMCSTDRKSLMESLAAKLAAGPPAKPVGLVKQVDHTAAEAGVGAEAGPAEKALGGVLAGSLGRNPAETPAEKEAAAPEETGGYVELHPWCGDWVSRMSCCFLLCPSLYWVATAHGGVFGAAGGALRFRGRWRSSCSGSTAHLVSALLQAALMLFVISAFDCFVPPPVQQAT